MTIGIGRRQFMSALGGAAAWPLAARAQQAAMPVIGMLNSGNASAFVGRTRAFLQGLGEAGFIEGRNVTIEHRYADDQYDRLPGLAAELVRRQVAVLFASGGGVAPQAAKAATTTIPVVFTGGFDPVETGLVASLNRPGGNVTGVSFLANALEAKRLGLLHDLVPQAKVIGVLVNPKNASIETAKKDLSEAAGVLGIELRYVEAYTARDFGPALAGLDQAGVHVLLVSTDSVFTGSAGMLVALAASHKMTAMYYVRDFVDAGGLMSYGTSIDDAFRQAGLYAGRILKGEKPAELPVMQTTRFTFVINKKTANAQGIKISDNLISLADEVIE
jgi:putative ABC transport system substrate-binding protein